MPYSIAGRNLMLDALKGTTPTAPITHAGLQTKGANKTGTAAASTDNVTSTSHGFSNGDLVVFTVLTGGTGLFLLRPYYVIGATTNTFQVSHVSGGSAVDITVDYSSITVNKLTEITGGSPAYARKAIAFAAASDGRIDDSTNGAVFDVPAAGVVDFVSFHSAVSAGTLLGIDDVTQETFAGQGTYTLTDAKLDLMAVA